MSLHDAVLEIADDLEKEAVLCDNIGDIKKQIASFVKQLRRACTAAGNEPVMQGQYPQGMMPPAALFQSPAAQHALEVEKAKAEFRKPTGQRILTEKSLQDGDGDMVRLVGGPAASDDDVPVYQSIDSGMPVGARMMLAGAPYKLTNTDMGRVLLYDEKELQRLSQTQK